MTIQEALEILKQNQITDSVQMLRRWIRQGKIKATMVSKKQGYLVDTMSLNTFIEKKQAEGLIISPGPVNDSKTANINEDTWHAGWTAATEFLEASKENAISEREKELIQKGLKEDFFKYSSTELLKKFPQKAALDKHFKVLRVYSLTLNRLGTWQFDETFNVLIDIRELGYPNRSLKIRAKELYTKKLFEHFESNK